jgi:hypothetical protein
MRTILARHPDNLVFEPEAINVMACALDEACAALGITDPKGREIIAAHIIGLARDGIADANQLRDRVLVESNSDAWATTIAAVVRATEF